MNPLNIDKQKEILNKIRTAQIEIRRKTLALLLHQTEAESDIERSLKPVIEPLEKILSLKQRKKNREEKILKDTSIKTPESNRNLNLTVDQSVSRKNPSDSIIIDTPAWDPFQSLRYENVNDKTPILISETGKKSSDSIAIDTPVWDPFQSSRYENDNDNTPILPTIDTEKWNEMFQNTIPEHFTKEGENDEEKEKQRNKRRKSASNLDYYLNMLHMNDDKIDKASGVVFKRGRYELNRIPIEFPNHDKYRAVKIGGDHFRLTPGINELLFMRQPNEDLITNLDVRNYKKIASLCAFTGSKKLKTLKLKNYIGGDGLMKIDTNKKTDYIYWDDPNELVTRLELLHASKLAGHSGHESEILSILQELQENKYIK